jgi:acetate kinase
MNNVILAVNSGSSSLKFALFTAERQLGEFSNEPLVSGKISGIGHKPLLSEKVNGKPVEISGLLKNILMEAGHGSLISLLLARLSSHYSKFNLVAAGHRMVHGGSEFASPVQVDEEVRKKLENLIPLAPLHQPHNLAAIDAIAASMPDLPQIACFDTGFHHDMPRLAQLFALPRKLSDDGVIRYGFHGLSYEYIASVMGDTLGAVADGKVIVAHLGNGASMCAMQNRRCLSTSMGFTALDGLMMGRRSGSLDAGVVLHLIQQKGLTPDEVWHMLYRESGLLGVSGISNNMKILEESTDPNAREAIDLFCYRAMREIGAMTAVLGGLDALVFTAGIGQNSARIRQQICCQLGWLGLQVDDDANDRNLSVINAAASKVKICVIPTNEEAMIAAATCDLIAGQKSALKTR